MKNLLEQGTNVNCEKINNPDVLSEYIHMLVLYAIGFQIATDSEMSTTDFKDFCENAEKWDCKLLINSAINVSEDASLLGRIAVTYVSKGIRVFHKKDENGHKLTIFSYDRGTRQLKKYKINLNNDFNLDDIKNQIGDNFPLTIYHCLDQLSEIEMPQEKLLEMFLLVYDNWGMLTREDWHQSIIEKISADNEAFYKYYDIFKKRVKLNKEKTTPLKL